MKVATDAEKEVLHTLDANFMSDEEDGEDDQSGLWIVRSPPWRSRRLLLANRPQVHLHGLFKLLGSQKHHQKYPKILPHHNPPSHIFPQGEGMMMMAMMMVKMTG